MTQPTDPTGATPPQWSAPVEGPTDPVPTPSQPASGSIPTSGPAPAVTPVPALAPATFAPIAAPPPAPTVPVAVARGGSRRRGVVDVVLVVAAIFAVGGVGFAAGRITAPTATVAAGGRFQGGNGGQLGTGGAPGAGFGGGFGGGGAGITIRGQVVSLTADQLTLKLASGQTVQIPLSSSTTYHTATAASASDVTTGSTVQVQVSRGGGNGGTGTGGTGNGGTGNGGTGNGGTGGGRFNLGAASDVTVVPQ